MKETAPVSLYCALCAKTLIKNQNEYCSVDCYETSIAFTKRRMFTPEQRNDYVLLNSSVEAYEEAIKLNILKNKRYFVIRIV